MDPMMPHVAVRKRLGKNLGSTMMRLILAALFISHVNAFCRSYSLRPDDLCWCSARTSVLNAENLPSFFQEIPNPFDALRVPKIQFPVEEKLGYEPTPEGLVRQAKNVIAADLGLLDPTLLDDSRFKWIGSTVDQPLGKTDYLAAGRFFDVRNAFPDLDYRAHDFRMDETDSSTVRVTCRTTGTMRGDLRLRDMILDANGASMKCPPEAISITFDPATGKVVKLCTGFVMDRFVGNTAGTAGVMAAALIAGQPISDWELYPPATVISRFFGRPVEQLPDSASFFSSFPETVMIQLAKGILSTNMAADDPTLLSDDFEFCTPTIGPIRKTEFLTKYAAAEFDGIDPSFSNFRVDPYDAVRVWVDVKPRAQGYEGSPQAMSFAFDEDGFCTRITSWAVLDPSIGNGGGLGGPEGYKYATGQASPDLLTRPWPRILGRARKGVLGVFTGKGVDDYDVQATSSRSVPDVTGTSMKGEGASLFKLSTLRSQSSDGDNTEQAPNQGAGLPAFKGLPPLPSLPLKNLVPIFESDNQSAVKRREKEMRSTTRIPQAVQNSKKEAKEALSAVIKSADAQLIMQKEAKAREETTAKVRLEMQKAAKAKEEARKAADIEAKARKEAAARKEQQEKEALARKRKLDAEAREKKIALEKLEIERTKVRKDAEKKEKERLAREKESLLKAEERKKQLETAARERRALLEKAANDKRQAQKLEAERSERIAKETKLMREREQARKAEAKKLQIEVERKRTASEAAKRKETSGRTTSVQQRRVNEEETDRERAILSSIAKAASRATITLFGLGDVSEEEEESPAKEPPKKSVKTPPRGVPSVSRWKQNSDGSISGRVKGSRSFKDGEKITTSPISRGTISSGEIVTTSSGSRYFLE